MLEIFSMNCITFTKINEYNEEINDLNAKDTKKINYKKLKLTDDYQYESEEEKGQTHKYLIKKNHLKNQQKLM